jgi:hypothetical protein
MANDMLHLPRQASANMTATDSAGVLAGFRLPVGGDPHYCGPAQPMANDSPLD